MKECPAAEAGAARDTAWNAGFCLLAAMACFGSFYRLWPLFEDHGVFHYMAWGLSRGLVPYRDIIEWNWPGILPVHALARAWSGTAPWGLRLLDTLFLAISCLALDRAGALLRAGPGVRLLSVTAFLASYFVGGYSNTAQRESFALAPLLLGCLPWIGLGTGRRPGPTVFFLGGLLAAMGVWTKPTVAPLGAALAGWGWLLSRGNGEAARGRLAAFLGGGMAGSAAYVGWLATMGALEGFFEWAVGCAFSGYKDVRLSRISMAGYLLRNVTTRGGGWGSFLLAAGLFLSMRNAISRRRLRERAREGFLAAACILAAAAAVWIQRKGAPYHGIPLQWAIALGAAVTLSASGAADRIERQGGRIRAGCAALVTLQAAVLAALAAQPVLFPRFRPWSSEPSAASALGRTLKPRLGEGETAVLFDASAHSLLAEMEVYSPFPYAQGVSYVYRALRGDPDRLSLFFDRLDRALAEPHTRYFIVELPGGDVGEPPLSPAWILRQDGRIPARLSAEYQLRPELGAGRFRVYERKANRPGSEQSVPPKSAGHGVRLTWRPASGMVTPRPGSGQPVRATEREGDGFST